MSEVTIVVWNVPAVSAQRLRNYTAAEYGDDAAYLNRLAESALRSYLGISTLSAIEDRLDSLLRQVGADPDSIVEKINSSREIAPDEKTQRVKLTLTTDTYDAVNSHVNSVEADQGVVLARAIERYISGGRKQGLLAKLDEYESRTVRSQPQPREGYDA